MRQAKLKPLPSPDTNKYDRPPQIPFRSRGCGRFGAIQWVILIIIIVVGLFYWMVVRPISQVMHPTGGFSLSNIHWPTVGTVSPDANKSVYYVTVTDAQLTEMFRQLNFSFAHDLVVTTNQKRVEIKGESGSAIRVPFFMAIVPKASSDGVVKVEVDDVQVAGIRAMPLVTQSAREQLGQAISNFINTQIKGKITDIKLDNGKMIASVVPN